MATLLMLLLENEKILLSSLNSFLCADIRWVLEVEFHDPTLSIAKYILVKKFVKKFVKKICQKILQTNSLKKIHQKFIKKFVKQSKTKHLSNKVTQKNRPSGKWLKSYSPKRIVATVYTIYCSYYPFRWIRHYHY